MKDTNSPPIGNFSPTSGDKKSPIKRLKYANNPFLSDVVATLGDKRVAVSMKANLAEIDNETGEYTRIPGQITKMISADREGFVKLYTAQIDAFFELQKPARAVVKYLIAVHQKEANRHLVFLHPSQAEADGYPISRATWFRGISELIDRKIIAPSTLVNGYFLNPAIFFNGDRTRFVVEVRKIRKREDLVSDLEAAGQQRLDV